MRRNIAYAFRMLAKNPGFTVVAMLTLGLGIGANTTIFSLINSLLLRPLPYKNPDALVALDLVNGQSLFPWSYPMFEELRHDQRTFANVAGFSDLDVNLTGIEAPQRLRCELVSASYFAMLGIEPERGRVFRPEEDREPDAHPLALVNDKLWRQNFGGDVGLIGRTIHLNELPYRVVGVMPRGFNGQSGDIDVWVPLTMAPSLSHIPKRLVNARNFWMRTLARLKPGIAVAQARAQLLILAGEIEKAYPHPEAMSPWKVQATSLVEAKTDPVMRKSLLIMFGAVGFVLLIACVNMANLMMGRAMSRRKEIAVRLAIGASRGALIRQLLTESVILGVAGGIAGFFVAAYAIDLTVALHPEASVGFWAGFARSLESEAVRMDTPVLVFNLAISILAGALFGLLPAFESTRLDLNQALKDVTSGWSAGLQSLRRVHSRSVLIAGEMALALVLLAGAGLMLESFARMLQTNIGAAADHVLTASVDLPPRKYSPAAVVRFDEQLLNRLRAAPGVEAVSVANSLPVRGETDVTMMNLGPGKEEPAVGVHSVSPDYPRIFRIPLRSGRWINDHDRAGSQKVLLVNETAARKFWPGENPIGKHVLLKVWDTGEQEAEVIGVTADVRYDGVEKPAENDVYVSFAQYPEGGNIVLRVAGDPMSAAPLVRTVVHELDPDLPVYGVQTMEQQLARATSRTRFSAVLLGVFGALALGLAGVGVYGVVAYSVAARTHEIGIRMALGASRSDVLKLVVGDGLLLCAAGLMVGIPVGLLVTRVLSSFLYGTKPGDPMAFAGVSLLLTGMATLACYIPARRAMKVDPLVALRYE